MLLSAPRANRKGTMETLFPILETPDGKELASPTGKKSRLGFLFELHVPHHSVIALHM